MRLQLWLHPYFTNLTVSKPDLPYTLTVLILSASGTCWKPQRTSMISCILPLITCFQTHLMFVFYMSLVAKISLLMPSYGVITPTHNTLCQILLSTPFNPLMICWGQWKNNMWCNYIQAATPRGLDNRLVELWACDNFGPGHWLLHSQELHVCPKFIYHILSHSWVWYWTYSTNPCILCNFPILTH